jgi:intraflagellar transport protein 140
VHVPAATVARENHAPTVIDWQPKGKTLATGWSDGQISIWGIQDKMQDDRSTCSCANSAVHRAAITFLLWNPAGTRLISGDSSGIVCVWKADTRGNITPMVQYRKKSALTTAVFCGTRATRSADAAAPAVAAVATATPAFFFGTESGTVCYADDLGHCTDVQQLGSSIDALMFYEGAMRLVIITRSLLMVQLQVGEDSRVTQFMKVKLSMSAAAVAEVRQTHILDVVPKCIHAVQCTLLYA